MATRADDQVRFTMAGDSDWRPCGCKRSAWIDAAGVVKTESQACSEHRWAGVELVAR